MSTMTERKPFEPLELNDPRRPIRIVDTVRAQVPDASERFLNHVVDKVVFPNGNVGWHHRITVPEGVMLAHMDEQDRIALVQNYRHPLGRDSVELPSGGADPEEGARIVKVTPEEKEAILKEVAIREFREEVGWDVDPMDVNRLLPGPLQGSVGFANQTFHTYLGEGGRQHVKQLDDGEAGMLTHDRYSLEDAGEMIGKEIVDPASSVAILALANLYGKRLELTRHRAKASKHFKLT